MLPSAEDEGATRLDLRGLNCPLPVLRTMKALAALPPGARLVVEATDPMSAVDIPHALAGEGHRLVERQSEGRVLRFVIERGQSPGPGI